MFGVEVFFAKLANKYSARSLRHINLALGLRSQRWIKVVIVKWPTKIYFRNSKIISLTPEIFPSDISPLSWLGKSRSSFESVSSRPHK